MMEAAVMKLHSHEYARASMVSSDLELAFEMQLNEALLASVRDMPGTSSGRTGGTQTDAPSQAQVSGSEDRRNVDLGGDTALAFSIQSSEFSRREQVLIDRGRAQVARLELSDELHQRAHDREFAKAMMAIDDEAWDEEGDLFERPFTRKSTTGECGTEDGVDNVNPDDNQINNLYFTMVREDSGYVGIAWAMTDKAGFTLFQQSICLGLGVNTLTARYTALINGLEYALSAGVTNIVAFGDSVAVSNQFSGKWTTSKTNLKFIDQVKQIGRKLKSLKVQVAPHAKITYVTNLARRAVASYFQKLANNRKACETSEECPICCEKVPTVDMFVPRKCAHKICRACLSQYVEVQVKANQVPVRCPQECTEHLDLDQCRPHLSSRVVESYEKCLTEASIPESQRVYCPFANCSALMSKDGISVSEGGSSSRRPNSLAVGCSECMECHRLFCVECHVPWHTGMACADYQKLPPEERDKEDAELYRLAKYKKWQRCKKCQSVIELDKGCYHMTCRCGYEFCYICGAEWRDKEATCKCKLWDENNIISDGEDDDYEDEEDYDDEGVDIMEDVYDSDFDPFDDRQVLRGDRGFVPPYKTRICRFWKNGFCREGEFCTFAHGDHELRYPPL